MVTIIYPNGNKIRFRKAEDYGISEHAISIIKKGMIQAYVYRMDGVIAVKDEDDLDLEEIYND